MLHTRMIKVIAAVGLLVVTLTVPALSTAGEIQLSGFVEARDYIVMDPPSDFHTIANQSGIIVVEEYALESLGVTVTHIRFSGDLASTLAKFPDIVYDDYDDEGLELIVN